MKLIFLPFLAAAVLACGNTSTQSPAARKELTMEQGISQVNRVIFFTPSSDELMRAMDEGGEEGAVSEMVSEFEYYAGMYQQNPGRDDVEVRFTDAHDITVFEGIKKVTISRTEQHPFGVIMTNGIKTPQVDYNIRLDTELRKMADTYFGPPKY